MTQKVRERRLTPFQKQRLAPYSKILIKKSLSTGGNV